MAKLPLKAELENGVTFYFLLTLEQYIDPYGSNNSKELRKPRVKLLFKKDISLLGLFVWWDSAKWANYITQVEIKWVLSLQLTALQSSGGIE